MANGVFSCSVSAISFLNAKFKKSQTYKRVGKKKTFRPDPNGIFAPEGDRFDTDFDKLEIDLTTQWRQLRNTEHVNPCNVFT